MLYYVFGSDVRRVFFGSRPFCAISNDGPVCQNALADAYKADASLESIAFLIRALRGWRDCRFAGEAAESCDCRSGAAANRAANGSVAPVPLPANEIEEENDSILFPFEMMDHRLSGGSDAPPSTS